MSKNRRPRKQRDIRKTPTSSPGKRSSPSVVSDSSAIRDLPELGEARAFWVQNRIAEALWRFDRIVSKHPDNVLALVDASRAFGAMYQYRRAESLLARLEELGHGRPEILHLAAQTYRLIRRPQKARELFQKVISLSESSVDSHLELALLCERQCEWDRAWDHILARLRYLPNDQEGRLVQGRLAMQRAEWETAERALRGVTRDAKAHWLTRSRAYVELARLLDVRGDFNSAWDAIWQAKSLARPQARPALDHRNRILPSLLSLIRDCSAQDYSRWASITKDQSSASSGPSQSVLLTGIPRSGTTLLEQILGAHSDIVVADEWDVFPRIVLPRLFKTTTIDGLRVDHLDQLSDEQLSRKRNLYTRCLAAGLGRSLRGAVVVDKNPSLLPLLPIYKRLFPQSKIIVALRDPRDILISCLLTHFPLNDFSVDFLSLETAARRVVQELESWLVLRERLPADWVECRYEDLVHDLPETVTKVLDRIGLRWQEPLGRHHEVAASPIFSPGFERANLAVDTRAVGRWRHYSHQIAPVLHHFDRILPQLGYDGPMRAR